MKYSEKMRYLFITGTLVFGMSIFIYKSIYAHSKEPVLTIPTVTVSSVPPTSIAESSLEGNTENVIDLALLLDTSGSMSGLINQAKAQLWKILNDLTETKRNGQSPSIRVALYEYGNPSRSNNRASQIRQITPFVKDMDLISKELFSLTTSGGDEYCGEVIEHSLTNLDWSSDPNALRFIFIAGNEAFNQGPVSYVASCQAAQEKDIFVNTIFCGNREEGIKTLWMDGATQGNGEYMFIDQNQTVTYISTPYDTQINDYNLRLNKTYVPYGAQGRYNYSVQSVQDNNAGSISKSNITERTKFKTSSAYDNSSWDLVDMYNTDKKAFKEAIEKEVKDQKKDAIQLEKEVTQNAQERDEIKSKIQELSKKRDEYIRNQQSNDTNNLGNSILESVGNQARSKGFQKEELVSHIDYDGFSELTTEVAEYREQRLINVAKFRELSKQKNVIVLDTRSKQAYDQIHIKGAIHLNFSDFTAEKIATIIPNKETTILIYCNNNFESPLAALALKVQPLALNIPTFINLYGYGYKDIYELRTLERIVPGDQQLEYEGTQFLEIK